MTTRPTRPLLSVCFAVERGDACIDLVIEGGGYPGARGRTWGPAEHCYPDEPAEVEIERVLVDDGKGEEWPGELTDEERERVEELLHEALAEHLRDAAEYAAEEAYEMRGDW